MTLTLKEVFKTQEGIDNAKKIIKEEYNTILDAIEEESGTHLYVGNVIPEEYMFVVEAIENITEGVYKQHDIIQLVQFYEIIINRVRAEGLQYNTQMQKTQTVIDHYTEIIDVFYTIGLSLNPK